MNLLKRHPKLTISASITGLMAVVILISQLFLINNSIRLDESQSLWQTAHTPGGVLHVVALDVHVPLYHLILHFWQQLVGPSIVAARSLSMLFFLATIPVVYLLARRYLRIRWSLLATALFALSPFMNWYANEARMYTLLVLVATLSQYFYVRLLQGKKGWLGYTLTAVVGVYTHYFFMFNLAAQGIYFLFNRKHFAPGSFKRFVALGILLAVELAPWLWYFHSLGSASGTSPQLDRPSTVDFTNVLTQFAFGFQDNVINTVIASCWPVLVVVALLFVRNKQRLSLSLGYLLAAGLLPIALAFAVSSVTRPFFVSRYMISCVAPLTIFMIWLVSKYNRPLIKISLVVIALAVSLGSFQQIHSSATPVKEDYQAAAQTISAEANARDIVILSAPFTLYPFEKVYNGPTAIRTLPNWDGRSNSGIPAFDEKTMPDQVKTLADGHRYAYVVLSYDQGYEDTIHEYFQTHYKLLAQKTYSHDLTVYKYQVGYAEPQPIDAVPAAQQVQ